MSKLQNALNRIYSRGMRPWGEDRAARRRRLAETVSVPAPPGETGDNWTQTDDHLAGCPSIRYVVERVNDNVTLSLHADLEVGWSINSKGTYTFRKHPAYSDDGRRKVLAVLSPADVEPLRRVLDEGRVAWMREMRDSARILAGVAEGRHVIDCKETVSAFVRFDVGLDVLAQVDATLAALETEDEA